MALLQCCSEININEFKSAFVIGRKFPGYSFWFDQGRVKCKAASKALATFKQLIRQMIRRTGGRSMPIPFCPDS